MAQSRNSGTPKRRGKENLTVKCVIGPCKISFPHFFEPAETDNGDRYQANFLFPPSWKDAPDYKKFRDGLFDVMEDMFGPEDDWPKGRNDRGPREVIRDATEKDYEGYKKGWFFVKASSKDQPGIVDANRDEVTNPREVYGGRWCRISVTIVAYDNKSKGVGVYLNSVQVLHHDEPFGGRGPAKNDFDNYDGPALSDDERGDGRGHARERDDDDRGSRGRDRDDRRDDRRTSGRDDREERGTSRGRDRDDREDDRGRGREDNSRNNREDEDRGSRGRSRDRDDDRSGSRDRDRDDDRPRNRDRDEDDRSRERRPSRDEDDDRGRGRERDRDDDDRRPSRSSRDRDDRDEKGWN